MAKDHKKEGGFRPVVSGCNSDTLGLSNALSEVVEAVCVGVERPYEGVSSEDMLARVYEFNDKMMAKDDDIGHDDTEADKRKENTDAANENVDPWEDLILIDSDVKALFPSLSALETGKAVRKQFKNLR